MLSPSSTPGHCSCRAHHHLRGLRGPGPMISANCFNAASRPLPTRSSSPSAATVTRSGRSSRPPWRLVSDNLFYPTVSLLLPARDRHAHQPHKEAQDHQVQDHLHHPLQEEVAGEKAGGTRDRLFVFPAISLTALTSLLRSIPSLRLLLFTDSILSDRSGNKVLD